MSYYISIIYLIGVSTISCSVKGKCLVIICSEVKFWGEYRSHHAVVELKKMFVVQTTSIV